MNIQQPNIVRLSFVIVIRQYIPIRRRTGTYTIYRYRDSEKVEAKWEAKPKQQQQHKNGP